MNWMDNLKVGDTVVIDHERIGTVEKVGKIHVTVNGEKYHKKNGLMAGGGGWRFVYIHEPTPERLADIAEARAKRNARVRYDKTREFVNLLTAAQLDTLTAAYEAVVATGKEQS
jgi:predicted DNA binding protein